MTDTAQWEEVSQTLNLGAQPAAAAQGELRALYEATLLSFERHVAKNQHRRVHHLIA